MADNLIPVITRVMQDINLNALGRVERQVRVEYMVGDHGPFTILLPESDFTAGKAKTLIQERVNQLRELIST